MGIFTTCGGLSRVIGPIGTSTIYQRYGTYAVYGFILTVLAIALLMSIVSFKSFKPREHVDQENSLSTQKIEDNSKTSSLKYK